MYKSVLHGVKEYVRDKGSIKRG